MSYLKNSAAHEIKGALFLRALKEATSPHHLQLEANVLLSALVSPEISIHQYYCYLLLMEHIHHAYEKVMTMHEAELPPGWSYRKSSPVIAEDLARINYAPPDNVKPAGHTFFLKTDTPGYLLGFMYVMEGSRLGGKVIYKNIHRILGLSENDGAKYVADYGFDTGDLWKRFINQFALHVLAKNLEKETAIGAGNAFAAIYDFIQSNRQLYEI